MTLISENVETQVRDSRYEQVEEQSQASYDIKKFFESCFEPKKRQRSFLHELVG